MQPNRPGRNHHLGVLSSGERKLEGKSFYLDSVKSRLAAVLLEAISSLGGVVEDFLHKDISCVVTGSQEGFKGLRAEAVREGSDGIRGEAVSYPHPSKQREGILINSKGNHPGTPRPMMCGSRGKVLLEKAIRNKDRLQGGSLLANASSWGVKIVHVDDFLSFVKLLKTECSKVKKPEKNTKKSSTTRVVKAVALKAPYLKVEDICRKYKPLHLQSMVFPALHQHGCRFSPFEPPPPPPPERVKEQSHNKARVRVSTSEDKPQTPLLRTPSLSCIPQARRKNLGYCECCHEPFKDQDEHLQSEQHRRFVQDSSHYNVVEQLVVDMQPGFDPDPTQEPTATLMRSPDPETATPSETEHAIQTLLIQGSSSCILVECPSHITRPATPCTPTEPPDPGPPSPCPDPPGQPSSTYSQPPSLSPQCLDPSDIVEPHSPYSDPPVLSPQAFPQVTEIEDAVVLLESDPGHRTIQVAFHEPPLPVYCLGHNVEGPSHDRLLVGDDRLTLGRAFRKGSGSVAIGRSKSLLQACSAKHNPRKRFRSASPDHSDNKRRRTSLIGCQRSDPSQGFSTGWTMQEAKMLITSKHEPVVKVTLKPVETAGTVFHEHIVKQLDGNGCPKMIAHTQDTIDQVRSDTSHQSGLSCGLANKSCPAVVGDKTTISLQREEFGTTYPTFLFPAATTFPRISNQVVRSSFCNRNPSRDICMRQQNCPDVPNSRFISPRDGTLCTASSQDSHPSLSQSYSSVCIESGLIPDMTTPSSSNSDWDCGLVFQLGPAPALLPSTEGRCGLDMEMLQRPCTWMHNTSYNSHLSSALRLPVSPPSLCGDETAPLAFSRTVMQSVEVQH
ncbi:uncharacterized protein dbf4b isoform X2 [Hypomesus transpacificus]|uniref:uncharacterized protein dbf4b isoform X2 n=1 Tax=Hypomesus transpacificus TaxID=137520 RepID=UPI001F072163|nr:uncharacterized protein dbf4b isoform X2 [Hypomesus transpacificus]